jgi:hypothetical protein
MAPSIARTASSNFVRGSVPMVACRRALLRRRGCSHKYRISASSRNNGTKGAASRIASHGIGRTDRDGSPAAARIAASIRVLETAFQAELEVWVVMHEDLRGSARCRAVFDALVEGLAPLTRAP